MATNLALNDELINKVQKIGGHKTKKAAVTAALEEYVQRRLQLKIIDAFGSFDYDPTYNHKTGRHRR